VASLAVFALLLTATVIPTGLAQKASSPEQAAGALQVRSIRGSVVDDTGQPLAWASVFLTPAGANSDSSSETRTVKTDEKGGFAFDAIADRPYTVTVFGFEYPSARQYHLPGEIITIRVDRGGVITGRVTSVDGKPLAGIQVLAKRIRGKDGEALRSPIVFYETSRSRLTDDRGIYRFWSLLPGLYIVSAGGFSGLITAYDDDSPTYYPSSTLGSANQLVLNSGQELTGIDIRYRGYTGHAISGTLMGNSPPSYVEVYLFTDNGDYLESISLDPAEATGPFAFAKASDGVYSLVAVRSTENQATAISAPKRVTVNGADISGINLKLLPLGSLSGRITLENDPKLDCKSKKTNKLTEIVLSLRSVGPPKDIYPSFIESQLTNAASPDSDGRFAMKRVPAGDYRIESWAPTDDWYVSTIALGSGARRTDVASKGIAISAGQIVSGLNVVMKNGAAGFSGDIIPTAGAALSTDLRVWLVPAEPNRVDERLSFAETEADNNGSFKFKNLAPGSYRIIAHAFHEKDSNGLAADTAEGRRRLLREAGDRAPLVELHPCEKQKGYRLKLLG